MLKTELYALTLAIHIEEAAHKETGNQATFEVALVNDILTPLITIDPALFVREDHLTGALYHELRHWYQWKHKLLPERNFYGLRNPMLPLSRREFRALMYGELDATYVECKFHERAKLKYPWKDCRVLKEEGLENMARYTTVRNLVIMEPQPEFKKWIDEIVRGFVKTDGRIPDLSAQNTPQKQ